MSGQSRENNKSYSVKDAYTIRENDRPNKISLSQCKPLRYKNKTKSNLESYIKEENQLLRSSSHDLNPSYDNPATKLNFSHEKPFGLRSSKLNQSADPTSFYNNITSHNNSIKKNGSLLSKFSLYKPNIPSKPTSNANRSTLEPTMDGLMDIDRYKDLQSTNKGMDMMGKAQKGSKKSLPKLDKARSPAVNTRSILADNIENRTKNKTFLKSILVDRNKDKHSTKDVAAAYSKEGKSKQAKVLTFSKDRALIGAKPGHSRPSGVSLIKPAHRFESRKPLKSNSDYSPYHETATTIPTQPTMYPKGKQKIAEL